MSRMMYHICSKWKQTHTKKKKKDDPCHKGHYNNKNIKTNRIKIVCLCVMYAWKKEDNGTFENVVLEEHDAELEEKLQAIGIGIYVLLCFTSCLQKMLVLFFLVVVVVLFLSVLERNKQETFNLNGSGFLSDL